MPEKYTLQSLIVQLENKRQDYNYFLAFRKEYKHACNISDIMKYYIDNKYNLRYFNNVKLRVICVLRYSTLHLQILWTLSYPAKKIHRFNLLLIKLSLSILQTLKTEFVFSRHIITIIRITRGIAEPTTKIIQDITYAYSYCAEIISPPCYVFGQAAEHGVCVYPGAVTRGPSL